MADDEFVIGFSDSEWTGIAPLLEEDVAMSSIAQDELGHAAALYGLLGELTATDPDTLAYDREPDAYRHCRLLDHGRGDWAMTIARRYLYDTADAVRLDALAGASWTPLADLVGKLIREERYHLMHAGAWLERLARDAIRGATAPDRRARAARPGCRDRVRATPRCSRHSSTPGSSMRRWPSWSVAGVIASSRSSRTFACLDRQRCATLPALGSTTASRSARFTPGFTAVRRSDPGATW